MKNKQLIIIGIILIIVIGGIFFGTKLLRKTDRFVGTGNTINNEGNKLNQYRSKEIPEECRLPEYENDLNWWKQHLSHHKNTEHCLEYYN